MKKIWPAIFLCLLLIQPLQVEARENPFVSKKAPTKEVKLPSVASKVFARVMLWQHQLNTKLTEKIKQLQDDRSWATLFPLILVSFLYGVIHAAGPGHGKVVVFTYFMSRRSSIKKGLVLGNLISLFHAVSGVIIVLTLYFVIKTAYLSSFEAISRKIKLVSYSLIVFIGLVLLLGSLFKIAKGSSQEAYNDVSAGWWDRRGVLPVALAVGMVPCPGVVIIMLFALSFNLLLTGVMMSFVMASGMAATISLAGLLSILGQEGLLRTLSGRERARPLVQQVLPILGSLLVIGLGTLLLSGAL
jgi:ABC-type nickel/cobalt efflux system permease component RcnA